MLIRIFCRRGIVSGLSTHVEIHFVSSLACSGFCQHKLRYILSPCWHVRCLVNASGDTVIVLAGMGLFWSIQVEKNFVLLLVLVKTS